MNAAQKFALFNLVIVLLTIATVVALTPAIGLRAQGGFGLLGLQGFGPLLFRKRRGEVLTDERDQMIQRRSVLIAYSIFWVAFFAACMSAVAIFGPEGAVPVAFITAAVWCGWILVSGVMSVATLVQYQLGGPNAA